MPPPMAGKTMEEETSAALSAAFPGMEEEPPSGGTVEVGQLM